MKHKPAIMDLSTEERQEILKNVLGDTLTESNKHLVAEALEFLNYLLQLLHESKINMHQLKQLFGFHTEKLKKMTETH